jgi:outer membrane protein OmpA-like peptidoglycan-associated protein
MSYKMLTIPFFVLAVASCNKHSLFFKKTGHENTLPAVTQAVSVEKMDSLLLAEAAPDPTLGTKAKRINRNVNTPYSDFAPFRIAERLYFSTASLNEKGEPGVTQVFSSLMTSPAVPWTENSKEPGEHTSHTAITADNKRIYFTYCVEVEPGKQNCEIFTRERAHEGYWLPAKKPKAVNMEGFTATQPSIGFDYTLRKEVLFFASNRPGGKGGLDIWCSPIEANGIHSTPFLMPFNSPQDDVTPFFFQQGQVLFFSSNRQSENGQDIYKAVKTSRGWGDAELLPPPYNSPYNDLYFSCHQWSGKSYFSSDRPGCKSGDPLAPCIGYDIFEAPLPVELKINVLLASSNALLEDAAVSVVEAETDSAIVAEDAAHRQFYLSPGKQYRISVEASGYSSETQTLETRAADVLSIVKKEVRLRQNAKLVVQTFNALDSLPMGGVGFKFISDTWVQALSHQNDEQATEHSFVAAFDDNSKLEASKPGYKSAVVTFDALTAIGPSAVLNVKVYLKPFAGLPVTLYFDNNQPKWIKDPSETESNLSYEQTVQQYIERKPFFMERYTEGLAQEAYEAARQKVLAFFDHEVAVGLRQLDELCSQIEPFLKKGYRLEILAEGQTSPLATVDYNQWLAARRINTVRNYLKTWRNGALKSYLYSGKLVLTSKYVKTTPTSATDAAAGKNNRRELEFSPEASRLRKVVIQDVRIQSKKV